MHGPGGRVFSGCAQSTPLPAQQEALFPPSVVHLPLFSPCVCVCVAFTAFLALFLFAVLIVCVCVCGALRFTSSGPAPSHNSQRTLQCGFSCAGVVGWTPLTRFPISQHGRGHLGHELLRGFVEVRRRAVRLRSIALCTVLSSADRKTSAGPEEALQPLFFAPFLSRGSQRACVCGAILRGFACGRWTYSHCVCVCVCVCAA